MAQSGNNDLAVQRDLKEIRSALDRLKTRETPGVPGTYTPTYTGSATAGVTTYSAQQGAWVRLGAAMFVTGTLVWTAATGTGDARISLPFTAANVSNQNFSGSVRTVNVTFANSTPQILIQPNTAFFILQSPLTNAASTTVQMEAAGNVVFSLWYFIE